MMMAISFFAADCAITLSSIFRKSAHAVDISFFKINGDIFTFYQKAFCAVQCTAGFCGSGILGIISHRRVRDFEYSSLSTLSAIGREATERDSLAVEVQGVGSGFVGQGDQTGCRLIRVFQHGDFLAGLNSSEGIPQRSVACAWVRVATGDLRHSLGNLHSGEARQNDGDRAVLDGGGVSADQCVAILMVDLHQSAVSEGHLQGDGSAEAFGNRGEEITLAVAQGDVVNHLGIRGACLVHGQGQVTGIGQGSGRVSVEDNGGGGAGDGDKLSSGRRKHTVLDGGGELGTVVRFNSHLRFGSGVSEDIGLAVQRIAGFS